MQHALSIFTNSVVQCKTINEGQNSLQNIELTDKQKTSIIQIYTKIILAYYL